MKFVTTAGELMGALDATKWATNKKSPKPALAMVLLNVAGNTLKVAATNNEQQASAIIQVEGVKDGVCLARPESLIGLLSAEPKTTEVRVSCDGHSLSLAIGNRKSKVELAVQDAAEFPLSSDKALDTQVELSAVKLIEAFEAVRFAASKDESGGKWATSGVFVEFGADAIAVTATDTRRLGTYGSVPAESKSCVIPLEFVAGLIQSLAGVDGNVTIGIAGTEFHLLTDGLHLASRTLEGRFPPYRDILAPQRKKKRTVFDFDKVELLRVVKQARTLLTGTEYLRVSIEFSEGGAVTLKTANPQTGQYEAVIGEGYTGGDCVINLNPEYLQSIVTHVDTETVSMSFVDGNSAVLFDVADAAYLLMPLTD